MTVGQVVDLWVMAYFPEESDRRLVNKYRNCEATQHGSTDGYRFWKFRNEAQVHFLALKNNGEACLILAEELSADGPEVSESKYAAFTAFGYLLEKIDMEKRKGEKFFGRSFPEYLSIKANFTASRQGLKKPAGRATMPTTTISADEIYRVLCDSISGQDRAMRVIADHVGEATVGLSMEGSPAGVFLLLGPTGSGKTSSTEALAEALHGACNRYLRIDCGEFQMDHEIAKLIGAPPGYLGHRETSPAITYQKLSAVNSDRCKLSIVLFDEIEKAAPSVRKILLGMLDKASLTLGDNTKVDLSNCLIFMTSNLGAKEMSAALHPWGLSPDSTMPSISDTERIAVSALKKRFAPEFVNRIDHIIVYERLTDKAVQSIFHRQIGLWLKHINKQASGECAITIDEGVADMIIRRGIHPEYGARELKRMIKKYFVQPIANAVHEHGYPALLSGARVGFQDDGAVRCWIGKTRGVGA